jgi:hypothetical protein
MQQEMGFKDYILLRIPGSRWLCCLSSIVLFKTVAREEIWELVFSVIKI